MSSINAPFVLLVLFEDTEATFCVFMLELDVPLTFALGPERQPDAAAGALGAVEDAPAVDEGDRAILAAVQAPPPPLATARTMPQRMARLEEDMHEIHEALAEQREVISAIAQG
ncbi:hypothetical protein Tco_0847652 [Tanacetum coccineum]